MDQHKMLARGIQFEWARKAVLKGYKLIFNKRSKYNPTSGFANLIAEEESSVEGVLFKIEDYRKTDIYEGCPEHYKKIFVDFEWDKNNKFQAVTYVAQESYISEGLKPTVGYMRHLIKGAEQHDLSEEYIKYLKDIDVLEE